MQRQRRRTTVETYLDALVRHPDEAANRRAFDNELQQFYRRRWNCPLKVPNVGGFPIDLFTLYRKVIAMGGWQKVSQNSQWADVADAMGVPEETAGAEYALKFLYMKHLGRYEQQQICGGFADDDVEPGGGGGRPGRGKSYATTLAATASDCPVARRQKLTPYVRASLGLPAYAVESSPYDRLVRSLESGVANEVDMAFNVCTLLSHPGPRFLRLSAARNLLDLLLAHVGIYADGASSLRALFTEASSKSARLFSDFWSASLNDVEVLEALQVADSSKAAAAGRDGELFTGLQPEYDTKDATSWRVFQVAAILRSLSFEPANKATLASSRPLIKFLFVCIHSCWSPLQAMALDTLSNIASEISFATMGSDYVRLLLRTLSVCLESADKLHIIRALESVAALCGQEANESLLCDFLEPPLLRRILQLVAVRDIMLCVYVLECVYQVSELGHVTCERIAALPHVVDTLVGLTTVEAVSFGPAGLMGMKVVEYHGGPQPHTAILPHPSGAPPAAAHSVVAAAAAPTPFRAPAPPPSFVAPPPLPPPSTLSPQRPGLKQMSSIDRAAGFQVPSTPQRGVGTFVMQQDQSAESLTGHWLRANCLPDVDASISRGQLYATYVSEMHKVHGALAVSVHVFTNVLRSVFPSCTLQKVSETAVHTPLMQIHGVRYSPNDIRSSKPAAANARAQPVPAGDAPLSNSSLPTGAPSDSPVPAASVVAQHPLMQQMLSRGSSSNSPGSNSNLTHSPGSATTGKHHQPTLASRLTATLLKRTASLGSHSDDVDTPDEVSRTVTPDSVASELSTSSPRAAVAPHAAHNGGPKAAPSPKRARLSGDADVRLEVCEAAQQAKAFIESGDAHEARIIKVENLSVADRGSPRLPDAQQPTAIETAPRENGNVDDEHDHLSDDKMPSCELTDKLHRLNGVVSPTKAKTDGGVKSESAPPCDEARSEMDEQGASLENHRTPSPDFVSVKENVTQCQANIRQLLTADEQNAAARKVNGDGGDVKTTDADAHATASRSNSDATDGRTSGDRCDQSPLPSPAAPASRKRVRKRVHAPKTRSCRSKSPEAVAPRRLVDTLASPAAETSRPAALPQTSPLAAAQLTAGTLKYMCEWNGCGKVFTKANAVYVHVVKTHISDSMSICKWPHCDQTVRLKWALVAHIQDHHCSDTALRLAAIRRHELSVSGQSNIAEPKPPPAHPGYSKYAAIEAIRRHAYAHLPRDLTEENEGPVTKSIRLTSCLILRNLARYSSEGRRQLKRSERHLAWLALSRLESSVALAQCLAELTSPSASPTGADESVKADSAPQSPQRPLLDL